MPPRRSAAGLPVAALLGILPILPASVPAAPPPPPSVPLRGETLPGQGDAAPARPAGGKGTAQTRPQTPENEPDLIIRADLGDIAGPLPPHWRPSVKVSKGHGHPDSTGDHYNLLPPHAGEFVDFVAVANPQAGLGATRLMLDLHRVGFGGLSIEPDSDFVKELTDWRSAGGMVVVTILFIPSALWPLPTEECCNHSNENPPQPHCQDDRFAFPDCRRYRPSDLQRYTRLLGNLITYLTVAGEDVVDDILFGDLEPRPSLGASDIHLMFWHEANEYRYFGGTEPSAWPDWHGSFPQWLRLYDAFTAAVERVESRFGVDLKVGTEFYTGNCLSPESCRRGLGLIDIDTFIRFLLKNPPPAACWDPPGTFVYQTVADPLPLDFMAFQKRTNEHQWLSQQDEDCVQTSCGGLGWHDQDPHRTECDAPQGSVPPHDPAYGFDWNLYRKFRDNYGDAIDWHVLDVAPRTNSRIYDHILSRTSLYPRGRQRYPGVELDNHLGAVGYLAQVWDQFEYDGQNTVPVPNLQGLWGEFWADPGSGKGTLPETFPEAPYPENWPDHDGDGALGGWDYGFYKGSAGMLFTNSDGLNMDENQAGAVSVKKAYYNVAAMMGRLEGLRVDTQHIDHWQANRSRNLIRGIVTRSATGDRVRVLWWYYLNPDAIGAEIGWDFSTIRDWAKQNSTRRVRVQLNGLSPDQYTRSLYVVDETNSNSWSYRNLIYDIYLSSADREAAITAINGCTLADCVYGSGLLSVALEPVEVDRPVEQSPKGTTTFEVDMLPWSAMLLEVDRVGPAGSGLPGDGGTGEPELRKVAALWTSAGPFGTTLVHVELQVATAVEIGVYDVRGRQVGRLATNVLEAGRHALTWDQRDLAGKRVPSGVYFVKLHAPDNRGLVTRLVVVR